MNHNNNLEPRGENAEEENRAIEIEWESVAVTNPMRSRDCFKFLRYGTFLLEIGMSMAAVSLGLWLSVTIAYNISLPESEQLHYKQKAGFYRNDTDFNVTCEPYYFTPFNKTNEIQYCSKRIPVSNGIFLALGITMIAVGLARMITMMIYFEKTPSPNDKMMMKAPFMNWCFVGIACIVCETRGTHYLYQMAYTRTSRNYHRFAFTNDPNDNFYNGCNYLASYFGQNCYYVLFSRVAMFFAHEYCKYPDCEGDFFA